MHRARMRIYLVCMSLACLDGTPLQPPPCTSFSAMWVDCMPAFTRLQADPGSGNAVHAYPC